MKANTELEPFVRLIEALEPWLEQVVIIGRWVHRLLHGLLGNLSLEFA